MTRRIYMVNPGHGTATIDVAQGLHHGFEANDCAVERYPLEQRASWFDALLQAEPRITPENRQDAAYLMAAEEMPARLLRAHPDLVVVVHGGLLGQRCWETLQAVRRLCPVHLVLTECPYEDAEFEPYLKLADRVWCNDRASADRWKAGYLASAFDPVVHHPPAEPVGGCPDVLFVGTGWRERCEFFSSLDWRGLHFQIVGPIDTWAAAAGTSIEHCVEHASIPGLALWPFYAGSGAVVNLHRMSRRLREQELVGGAWSLNPRCYQVPACGGLLLSDRRPEWEEVFGDELPAFEDAKELEALIRYFLKHPRAREQAVERSMACVQPHSYTARAATILKEL